MTFTAEQKIKYWIINWLIDFESLSIGCEVTPENIDDVFDGIADFSDAINETRCNGVETNIEPSEYSRHYESKSLARKFHDGTWVGWTYWYGGGKHGRPEEVEWITTAYDLDCEEQEKIVTVRNFSKK